MKRSLPHFAAAFLLAAASGLALEASAADVRTGISSRETYVGMPVTLQIQVANATDFDPPTVPEIAGLRIEPLGEPSRSTQITNFNGNTTTRSSVIYSFAVTPTQPGNFHIPAISVRADGQTLSTRPFDFVASKSETGDLLFVEIAGKEKQIYVGQSLDLQLKIWVRPYHDKEHNITLSEADMWQLLSEKTHWGPFAERIEQLAANNERPVATEVLRKDRDGENHSYYLFEIDAKIYPKKPGRIDANDVQVVVLYPTAIGQARDPFARFFDDMQIPGGRGGIFGDDSLFAPFGSQLTVESVRPIVADAKVEPIEVLDIPIAARPSDYRGAVGKYRIVAQAKPIDVKAGDPITLLLGVAGTGPMDLVQAPPLAELPALAKDFKVPDEPLAGYVEGARKVFSTTIRPRKAGITEIPPIPFTYFDPEVGKFVTTASDPIEIKVAPADTLALADVVGRNQATSNRPGNASAAAAEAGGPRLAIITGNEVLTNESAPAPISRTLMAFLALPPIAVLTLLLVRGRHGFSAPTFRFGSSVRQCQTRIEQAAEPADVDRALRTMLAKRFGLSARADAAALVGGLRSEGHRSVAVRCERIFEQCERPLASGLSLADLKREAIQVVGDLQSQRRPARAKPAPSITATRRQSSASRIAVAFVLAGALLTSGNISHAANDVASPSANSHSELNAAQQQTLLVEANDRYNLALSTAANDSAEAKQAFADAAEKYELLVESGVHNNRLYFNLANAYLESGAAGQAVANYRRALRLDPTNREARTNLAYAESRLAKGRSGEANGHDLSLADYVHLANGGLNRFVSPHAVLMIAILSWIGFWVAIGLRLCDLRFAWKTLAISSLLVAAATAASYAASCREVARNEAVVVAASAELRTGDGPNFPGVGGTKLSEGQSIGWVKRRGQWVQVRTEQGLSGWLPIDAVEIL
jgi:tetratricopeptide (TPR) repeat protein